MTTPALHLGIDIGTQGVRVVVATSAGVVVDRASSPLVVPAAGDVQEQDPMAWWSAVVDAVGRLGSSRAAVASLAVSCTSGSVCAMDGDGSVIGPGLLYADRRGVSWNGADSSWAIAKIAWLAEEHPELVASIATFTSPGGFVASRLCGTTAAIDVTQALKFGFDPERSAWDPLPIDADQLPSVVATGDVIGSITSTAAVETGLPAGALVVAGATDGVAGQFACRPSSTRWAVAIGSTIVWKAMAPTRLDRPDRGIYSHRGPGRWWLPGAASNAGARVLAQWADPAVLHSFAEVHLTPAAEPLYPSVGRGERFPFLAPDFEPWAVGPLDDRERYASELVGMALVERWGRDELVAAGCVAPASVASTGGTVAARRFLQLRADVLGVPVEIPSEPSSAFGAAVVAAAPSLGGVLEAGEQMVSFVDLVEPDPSESDDWDDAFRRFRDRCVRQLEGTR